MSTIRSLNVDLVIRPTGRARRLTISAYNTALFARAALPSAVFAHPSFFLIGAQKAGTTSLYSYLRQHSGTTLPLRKELHLLERQKAGQWARRAHRNAFPIRPHGARRITGEATPFMTRPWMPERLFEMYPTARLIAVLRDPVDRILSHYDHVVRVNGEHRTLEQLLELEHRSVHVDPKHAGSDPRSLISRSMYRSILCRWVGPFPKVLLVSSRDLRERPDRVMRDVEDWLGLAPFEYDFGYELNSANSLQQHNRTSSSIPDWAMELLRAESEYWNEQLATGSRIWTRTDTAQALGSAPYRDPAQPATTTHQTGES